MTKFFKLESDQGILFAHQELRNRNINKQANITVIYAINSGCNEYNELLDSKKYLMAVYHDGICERQQKITYVGANAVGTDIGVFVEGEITITEEAKQFIEQQTAALDHNTVMHHHTLAVAFGL